MRRCVDSDDADAIRNAYTVLARLGDVEATAWLAHDDSERAAAYLEKRGVYLDEDSLFDALADEDVENDVEADADVEADIAAE